MRSGLKEIPRTEEHFCDSEVKDYLKFISIHLQNVRVGTSCWCGEEGPQPKDHTLSELNGHHEVFTVHYAVC
jgi:hypothetical protein